MLNSERTIEVNIAIMRAFVRLREVMSTHKDLARKLDDLERKRSKPQTRSSRLFSFRLAKQKRPAGVRVRPVCPVAKVGF